ncbi:MFS transporter [Calidifontibacillus erzurumensis]|uniref:MFS transporter n=1 Tax=Calidifontibacillus erzurumensis TaxID=2741433 RepID=UPI0035B4FF8F
MNLVNEQVYKQWIKNIVIFLTSQTVSLFGSSLVQYAIFWYVTLNTKSGLLMTIFILCGFVPTFLLSPFAGVWADRFNRKMLIILADALVALATLVLAVLFLAGYKELWLLFAMASIRAIGTGIQTPAIGAILPQIVPEEKLTKVNGINGSIQALVMLVAPMASAALLTMASLEMIFFIDIITAAVAILFMLTSFKIPVHRKAREQQMVNYFTDLKQGIAYIKQHPFLLKFFLFLTIYFIFVAPAAFLTPLQVARSFGDEVWRLTAIEIAFSSGMMIGGVVIAAWGGFRNRIHTMTLASLLFGVCTFSLGITPNFWIYLFFMMVTGVAMPFFNTPSTVLLQEKIEEDFQGRIFGIYGMISTSMMPIGMLIFGPIADYIKIEWLLIGTGLCMFIQSFFLIGSKVLVEAGKPAN